MRVTWLIDSLGPGGAEALVPRFAEVARRAGLDLEIVTLRESGSEPAARRLRATGTPTTSVRAVNLRDGAAWRRWLAHLRATRPDLIHCHLTDATIWACLAAMATGIPVVATLHEMPDGSGGGLRQRLRTLLARALLRARAIRVIAVSRAAVDAHARQRPLPLRRLAVVPNPAPAPRPPVAAAARAERRAELGHPSAAPLLLAVAVLRPAKGLDTTLRALPAILERHPDARLWVVGSGPAEGALRTLAGELGLAESCRFLGQRDDVLDLYPLADLLVHASRREALPTVVLEAMAAGLPVVATPVGGTPELIVPGSTGELVPPGRPGELAAAVCDLLDDPDRARRMGREARQVVESRFTDEGWLRQLETIYRQAVTGGARPAGRDPDSHEESAFPRAPTGTDRLAVTVVEPFGSGGLIHYAYQLCQALAGEGLEVELLTDRRYELRDLPHAFRVRPLLDLWEPKPAAGAAPASSIARLVRRVGRALRYVVAWGRVGLHVARTRPDVVQLGDLRFAGDVLAVALLRRLSPALVDVCHNVDPFRGAGRSREFRSGPLARALHRHAYRSFDRVFVHHDSNRHRFLARYPVDPERVRVIVHGNQELFRSLDDGTEPDRVRREIDLPAGARVALLFGTLSAYKGIGVAIRAAALLRDAHPDLYWVVVGFPLPGFDVEAHRALAERLGVGDRVRLVPRYVASREVGGWMRLADVVALPYREGYQSGVLQLAQTFGVPVVAARVGSFPEVIDDGRDGLLHEPGDERALASAVARLLRDEPERERMGRAARERSLNRHGWGTVAATLASEYRRIRRSGEPLERPVREGA